MKKSLILLILLGILTAATGCKTAPADKEAKEAPAETAMEPAKQGEPAKDSEKTAEDTQKMAGIPVQTADMSTSQKGSGTGSGAGDEKMAASGKKSSANSVVQTQKRIPAPVKANTAVRPSPHPAGIPTQAAKQSAAKGTQDEKVESKKTADKDVKADNNQPEVKEDTAKKETAKKETAKADTSKKDTTKKETAKADTAKKDATKKETAKADTSKKDTTKKETAKADTAKKDTAKKETAKADTSKKDATKKETAKADTSKKDATKKEAAKTDTVKKDTAKKETAKADTSKKDTTKKETAKADTVKKDTTKKETAKADTSKKDTAKADTKTTKQEQGASRQNAAMSDTVNETPQAAVQKEEAKTEAAPYVASAQIIDASWMIEQADVSFVSKQYKGSGKMFVTILAQYKGDLVPQDFQEATFFSPTDIWSLDAETARTLMEIDTKNKLLTFKHLAAGDGEGAVSLGKWFVSITLAGQKPFEKELNVTGIGGQTIAADTATTGNNSKKIIPMVVPVVQAAGEQAALEFPVIQSVSRDAETIEIIFSINDERVKNAYFYFDIPDEEYYRDSGSMIDPAGQPVNGCRVFSTDGKKCQYILRKDENNKVWFNKATRCFLVVSDVNRVASPWEEHHRTIGAAAQISR